MENIYIAAYKDYANYNQLKTVCDRITSDMKKEDVTFFVTTGECGDNTCMKYAVDNGFRVEDWFPNKEEVKKATYGENHWLEYYNILKEQKAKYISKADHVILVSDYDKKNNGIGYALRLAGNHGKTISVLFPDKNELHVHKVSNPNRTYVYRISNNSMNFEEII